MFGNPMPNVYIADGFMDDAEELIHKCTQRQEVLDFQSFCIVWKEMDIGCMYKDRTYGAEVAELSEEVLQIAKHYMLANTSYYEESIAGLFLVYSLLNLQPYPGFASLRLVPDDVPAIMRLESIARKGRRHDVLYILGSVLITGSQFHADDRERGMEAPIKKYLDRFSSIDSIRNVRPKGEFFRQNEELDLIREMGSISKRYMDAKKQVIGSQPPDRSLQYVKEGLPMELNSSLRKILSGIFDEEDDTDDYEENASQERSQSVNKEEHTSTLESIKARAMKGSVNPMKHLLGLEERKQQAISMQQQDTKSEIKTKSGKVKTDSSTKPQDSLSKRRTSPRGNKRKKSKANPEASTSKGKTGSKGYENEPDDEEDIFPDYKELEEDEESQAPNNIMNLEIGYLPSLVKKNDAGHIVQIELIDQGNPQEGTKVDVIQLKSLPDLDSIETQPAESEGVLSNNPKIEIKDIITMKSFDLTKDDDTKAQKMFERQMNRKKTHLRSKLKRMGILPVANFKDPA